MVINILIGTLGFLVLVVLFLSFVIYKLKKRDDEFKMNNLNLSHDLKTLLATFRLALDGLTSNQRLKEAIENEEKSVRGGLLPLIEIFEGIGQELSRSIRRNGSNNK